MELKLKLAGAELDNINTSKGNAMRHNAPVTAILHKNNNKTLTKKYLPEVWYYEIKGVEKKTSPFYSLIFKGQFHISTCIF